jgi:pSer/pThr/pTyr-binding forkhead associated (FHA) protein
VIAIINLIPRLLSVLFVLLVYVFIIRIIKMVNTDIAVMQRKKNVAGAAGTYLKLLNIRSALDFHVEESYPISADMAIGRDRRCEIVIDDPFLSKRHCEILVRDGVYYLNDLDSTNGTFLNGSKVEGDAIELMNGDKISIGQLSFIFVNSEGD